MKLEDQVISLNLARRFKELGVRQKSLFAYLWQQDLNDYTLHFIPDHQSGLAAFTVAELGEFLHYKCPDKRKNKPLLWLFNDESVKGNPKTIKLLAKNEADARGKMLIYLIENKLLTLPQ